MQRKEYGNKKKTIIKLIKYKGLNNREKINGIDIVGVKKFKSRSKISKKD